MMLMNYHEKSEKQIVIAQLICFLFAAFFGFAADLFGAESRQVIYKFVDAFFITGTILVAMKLAGDGWEMPAAGYTLLSIAWGVFFLAKDFQEQSVGEDIFASAFYFLLPSMLLISFYARFPLLIKIIGMVAIIPSLIGLISVKTGISLSDYNIWRKISYQAVHITSLFWGFFFLLQYRKSKGTQNNNIENLIS